jgi:hypothetical protein
MKLRHLALSWESRAVTGHTAGCGPCRHRACGATPAELSTLAATATTTAADTTAKPLKQLRCEPITGTRILPNSKKDCYSPVQPFQLYP